MDLAKNLVVVATAGCRIQLIDLNNPGAFAGEPVESLLKFSTRCVAVAPDATSYAIGGIEGRVGIQYVMVWEALRPR
jgi:mRNA export factor